MFGSLLLFAATVPPAHALPDLVVNAGVGGVVTVCAGVSFGAGPLPHAGFCRGGPCANLPPEARDRLVCSVLLP